MAHSRRVDLEKELDDKLNQYSLTRGQQIFDDSPNKSEMQQFNDFSGSHSQFDRSLERGMTNKYEKSTDFSFKDRLPALSSISSLSSRTETPRKAASEGGRRPSFNRFSPVSSRKVTALGMHESESDYSPSKVYQKTPHVNSKLNPTRKVSPKSFKNASALFNELGLDETIRLPRDMPDLTNLLNTARKLGHKEIESIPVSADNQKLFAALQDLQVTVENLERRNKFAEGQISKLKDNLKQAEDRLTAEQQRSKYAEIELKQQLSKTDNKVEARIETLVNALNQAKKDLENRTLELDLAREEMNNLVEERNGAIERLARALENVDRLQAENDALRAQLAEKKPTVEARITEQVKKVRKPPTPVEIEEVSDAAIELSKSVVSDSEIERLARELEEMRRKKKQRASKPRRKPIKKVKPAPILSTSESDYDSDLSLTDDEPAQILRRKKAPPVDVERVINELSKHDKAKCTICSKKKKSSMVDDANATIRPSQEPVPAIHSVLSGLEDEFRHLKLKYHDLTDEYQSLDPGLSKRARKEIASSLRSCIESLEVKADQIYALFDVLEVV